MRWTCSYCCFRQPVAMICKVRFHPSHVSREMFLAAIGFVSVYVAHDEEVCVVTTFLYHRDSCGCRCACLLMLISASPTSIVHRRLNLCPLLR